MHQTLMYMNFIFAIQTITKPLPGSSLLLAMPLLVVLHIVVVRQLTSRVDVLAYRNNWDTRHVLSPERSLAKWSWTSSTEDIVLRALSVLDIVHCRRSPKLCSKLIVALKPTVSHDGA